MNLSEIRSRFVSCPCGKDHSFEINEIATGSGITSETGEILKRNGFKQKLLFVADKNTLKAANGVVESLQEAGFELTEKIYNDLRVAEMSEVEKIVNLSKDVDGIISVGSGSLNDICRLAAARSQKPLCLFATAPSMDGFASYCAPITDGNFKITYPAKSPEVIIADTRILAAAPTFLKSAGFGDMVGKYVGLIDWQVSNLVSGEYYCPEVAAFVREAVDDLMELADKVTANDEQTALAVFEGLVKTGIGMSLVKTSRPASGTEHILSHFWECKKLLEGKTSDFHGRKVGVATLLIMEKYNEFSKWEEVDFVEEKINWQEVEKAYGELYSEVEKLNNPPISQEIDKKLIKNKWQRIREIINSVPSCEQIKEKMKVAGCPLSVEEIGVSNELKELGMKFHPHMRHRISLMRLKFMFEKAK